MQRAVCSASLTYHDPEATLGLDFNYPNAVLYVSGGRVRILKNNSTSVSKIMQRTVFEAKMSYCECHKEVAAASPRRQVRGVVRLCSLYNQVPVLAEFREMKRRVVVLPIILS